MMSTVVKSPSFVPALRNISLIARAPNAIQPDRSISTSVRVADHLTVVPDKTRSCALIFVLFHSFSLIHKINHVYRVRQKRITPGFFADFSETTWNINIKLYMFVQRFHLCLIAEV